MRNRASLTAVAVAAARALARVDEKATTFLPWFAAKPIRAVASSGQTERVIHAINALALGFVDHLALRTVAVDAAMIQAASDGMEQFVIVGAGLDSRAYRLAALKDRRVFEVDHPETQALKRERAEGTKPFAEVTYVPLDLQVRSLEASLRASGHDATGRTFWIVEGVAPYLSSAALSELLRSIASRSAPGSRLALTYGTNRVAKRGLVRARVGQWLCAAIGEPIIGLLEPDEVAELLRAAHFRLISDTGTERWAVLYARRHEHSDICERLALAEVDSPVG